MDEQRGIGLQEKLPWPYKDGDLKWFKEVTTGHHVLMGNRTWKGLGLNHLKNRHVWVLTKQNYGWNQAISTKPEGECSVNLINDISNIPNEIPTIIVAGGLSIYRQLESRISEWLITTLKTKYNADVFLPEFETRFTNNQVIMEDEKMKIVRYY